LIGLLPHRYVSFILAFALAISLLPATVLAESDDSNADSSDQWIIKLDETRATFQSVNELQRIFGDSSHRSLGSDSSTLVVSFEGETRAANAIARLANHPTIDFVEPDVLYHFQDSFIPNDPEFQNQQWAETVNLPEAWTVSAGSSDVVVSVVDSGIRSDHPDLQDRLIPGKNFVDDYPDDDTEDYLGHGTEVAGIIAATGNNGIGIAGASMNVQLLPMRVGITRDGVRVSLIAEAVQESVDRNVDVINLSLGSPTQSARLEQALDYAAANDVVVIAAAGNDANQVSFPGSSPSTIAVGATTLDGSDLAYFSSRLSVTDLVAPGMGILTTSFNEQSGAPGYAVVNGTSYSTPIVTGAAALIRSVNPELDVHQIRTLLTNTAQKTFTEQTVGTGAGLLDADAAVREALLPSLGSTWMTADDPVANLQTSRTWLWGPHSFDLRVEPYAEAENGTRLVAYFDKSRMEVTDPYGDRTSDWYVTNGLLVQEMISGRMQMGDDSFEQHGSAEIPVAGDPENNNGPTYASFSELLETEADSEGDTITSTLSQDGTVGNDSAYAEHGVFATEYIPETGHRIASVFWDYLNSAGTLRYPGQYAEGRIFNPTFFATGFPITAAYWSQVTVGEVEQDVLIQCFERRCLTYTPANDPGWQVEMGNVGQHYYRWRYGDVPEGPVAQDPAAFALSQLR
jgi:thermitase